MYTESILSSLNSSASSSRYVESEEDHELLSQEGQSCEAQDVLLTVSDFS